MQSNVLASVVRAVGYAVLLLMALAIVYAGSIGLLNWAGIGV